MTKSNRIRARHAGFISPITRRPIFRIEDEAGRLLRRISSARNLGEAIAHYWRGAGRDAKLASAMPEPPPDASLRHRIDAARSARGRGPAIHEAMRTHELPLPSPELVEPAVPLAMPDEPVHEPVEAVQRPTVVRKRREPRPKPPIADLFELPPDVPEPEQPEPPEPVVETVAEAPPEPVSEPEPVSRPEPAPEPEPDEAAPYHLDPHAVMLQQVDHRNLRPSDRSDSYLYHVTNRAEAAVSLDSGLVVSAQDPIILTERQGVAYWLSVLAEDFDVILDGPADFVVLRMRRFAVEELLEPDLDTSRSAGCSCYLLTGGAGPTGRS